MHPTVSPTTGHTAGHTAGHARNCGLDTLRALAIVLVVLHHYVLFVSGEETFGAIGTVGWIGVDLFFALSGYLIGNQIFGELNRTGSLALGRFYARRLLRTLPNFYVVLALYFLWPWFRAGLELPPLWRFITFTQNINLQAGTAFSHAWSLCIEEQFYLLLPAAALLLAPMRRSLRWSWAAIALVLAGGMLARGWIWHDLVDGNARASANYFKYIYYSSLCRVDELVAGVALALLKNYHVELWRRLSAHGNVALAAGLAITLATCARFIDERMGAGVTLLGYPMLALGFALLIVAALSDHSVLRKVRIPGAESLAVWSYAIYLTHKQICILANAELQAIGLQPDQPRSIAIMLALSVLVGYALYRCVETPFMRLRDRIAP